MGKFDFEDGDQEPTFSLYDFKKWLSKQGDDETLSAEHTKKEETKEEFKENFKERVRKRKKKN